MLQEIIVLTVAYIVLIGLFQPNKNKTTTPQTATPQTATLQTATPQTATPQTATLNELNLLNIRQLKALAKSVKLKGYGNMRKNELVLALS